MKSYSTTKSYSGKSASRRKPTRDRLWRLAALCAPMALAACFQEIDSSATQGTRTPPPVVELPPGCVEGDPCATTFTQEHPIGTLINGETATEDSACAVTIKQAMDVIETSCVGCHAGATPQVEGFDITDLMGTKTSFAHGQTFAGKKLRYLIPGDPDKSLIYYRIEKGSMPKAAQDPSGIQVRQPTLSDISLLNGWIKFCIGVDPMPGEGADPASVLQ